MSKPFVVINGAFCTHSDILDASSRLTGEVAPVVVINGVFCTYSDVLDASFRLNGDVTADNYFNNEVRRFCWEMMR